MNKILLSTPTMHGNEQHYIKEAFDTNWVAPLGANVDGFENEIAKYLGINDAAACVSGTSALFLAYKLVGIKKDDIVFCSDLTFSATVNPICYLGAKPVFIDSEYETWNMDPKALEAAFEKYPNCKYVSLVHLYGTPAKITEIMEICKKHNAILIEDAAESLSATYKGQQTGTFGMCAAISFNGNKIITTSGGGMLLSNDESLVKRARYLSTQARQPVPWYQHTELGYNFRMSNIVAGIGRGQLEYLDNHKELKTNIYNSYKTEFVNLPLSMNPYEECSSPNHWLSCILLDKGVSITPSSIIDCLNNNEIESRHIWKPMHMQPVFADYDFIKVNDYPVSVDIFERGVCLPSDIKMTHDELNSVVKAVKSCF